MNLAQILVNLLSFENEKIQGAACGVLSKLSVDRDGIQMIQRENPVSRLMQLLHSTKENIRTYASATLYNLGVDIPEQYNCPDFEIKSEPYLENAFYQDDSNAWAQQASLSAMQLTSEEPFIDMMYHQAMSDPTVSSEHMHLSSPWNEGAGMEGIDSVGLIGYQDPTLDQIGNPPQSHGGEYDPDL